MNTNIFEVKYISLSEKIELTSFQCTSEELNDFFWNDAKEYQKYCTACTHLAYYNDHIVGYFTLINDCVEVRHVNPDEGQPGYKYSKYSALKSPDWQLIKTINVRELGGQCFYRLLY